MLPSTRHNLSRDAIVERFRQRIQAGDRSKLSRDELMQLAQHFVDRLAQMQEKGTDTENALQELAEAEIALLEEGYPQQSVSSQYLPTYRKLIQEAIESGQLALTAQNSYLRHWKKRNGTDLGENREHFVLKHLKYDVTTYEVLRQSTTANNNKRQDNLQIVPLQRYLDQVMRLLESDDERRLAIAIAALTGRRHTEVISKGSFGKTRYPYMLRFTGQQKKAEAASFDILTLAPAEVVLEAIERFRSLAAIAPLVDEEAGHDDPRIDTLNMRINREVKKCFQDTGIVPVPDGFKSVSIHRLRGIYGAIAIHYFCPEWKHEHRFLQYYLGHVINGTVAPNSRATEHYFHYRLAKPDGSLISVRGIKIPANGLPPLPNGEQEAKPMIGRRKPTPLKQAPQKKAPQKQAKQPQNGERAIALKEAVKLLKARGLDLNRDTLESWKKQRGINNRFWSLREEFGLGFDFQASTWVDYWQGAATHPNSPQPSSKAPPEAAPVESMQSMESIESLDGSADTTAPDAGPSGPMLQVAEADLERLFLLAAQQKPGVKGAAEALQVLLNRVDSWENHPPKPQPETLEAIAHQASTLAWLTKEVETLRAENQRLQAQMQAASQTPEATQALQQQIDQLQQENQSLKQQLSRFEAVRKALLGDLSEMADVAAGTVSQDSAGDATSSPAAAEPSSSRPESEPAPSSDSSSSSPSASSTPSPTPALSPAPAPASAPTSAPPRVRQRRWGSAKDRARAIFDSISLWNQQHPDEPWAINASLLEREFGINRKAAKEFEADYQSEIERFHNLAGIENPSTQNRGKDTEALKQFVDEHLQKTSA